jgi:hypothetical protein
MKQVGRFSSVVAAALDELLARRAARELARRGARQRVRQDELDQDLDAELGVDLPLQPIGQQRQLGRIDLAALHDQDRDLVLVVVGDRERRRVGRPHFGLLLGQVLEVLRPDVAALDDHQVLGPTGEVESPFTE